MEVRHTRALAALALTTVAALGACSSGPSVVMITATPEPTALPGPQVTLYYEGFAQFELISPEGTRVLIDVHNPAWLTSPPGEQDILVSTHLDGDHFVQEFSDAFPGEQMNAQEGELSASDVNIRSVAAAHTPDQQPRPVGSSDYILIIDTADMRIAHFGDIGQTELTQEQVDALGEVDVAIIIMGGSCSIPDQMNSFGLLDQVQPKLVIPTHAARETLEQALSMWPGYYVDPGERPSLYDDVTPVRIGRSDLPEETALLPLGEWAAECRSISDLIVW